MHDQGQIARAFASWQKAHQKLTEAELRLAAATQAFQQGIAPRPDQLHREVLDLKAEQEWRYSVAADTLRQKHSAGPGGPSARAA